VAEHDAADRPREIAGRERGKRGHQRHERRAAGKQRVGYVAREDAEDDEIVELQRAAEAGEQYDSPAAASHSLIGRHWWRPMHYPWQTPNDSSRG